MGLARQQGPLAVGHFLVEQPLPERLLFAEPLLTPPGSARSGVQECHHPGG